MRRKLDPKKDERDSAPGVGGRFEITADGPMAGLATRLPSNQIVAAASAVASNARFDDGVVRAAPGYGVLVTNPDLDSSVVMIHQGSILFDESSDPLNVLVLGTSRKLYSVQRLPPSAVSIDAGPDQTIGYPQSGTAQAVFSGQYDLPLSILWTQISGPAVATLTGTHSLNLGFALPELGVYTFEISVSNGMTSASDTVNITQTVWGPMILVQPADLNVDPFATATFTVVGAGLLSPSYQWYKNSVLISGATGTSYSILGAQVSDDGAYSVVLTNTNGSVTSRNASLVVAHCEEVIVSGNFVDVAYGNGVYVAVGDGGAILSSSDGGVTWVPRTSGVAANIATVVYGNGYFVAAGTVYGAPPYSFVIRSSDGVHWSAAATFSDVFGANLAFGDGVFVLLLNLDNGYGLYLTMKSGVSADGVSWAWHTSTFASGSPAYPVIYNTVTARFEAVIRDGHKTIASSDGGVSWSEVHECPDYLWDSFAYGNGTWAMVTDSPSPRTMASPDLLNWSVESVTAGASRSVRFGLGSFVAVGASGGASKSAMTSEDGAIWTFHSTPSGKNYNAVGFGPDCMVVVGANSILVGTGTHPFFSI